MNQVKTALSVLGVLLPFACVGPDHVTEERAPQSVVGVWRWDVDSLRTTLLAVEPALQELQPGDPDYARVLARIEAHLAGALASFESQRWCFEESGEFWSESSPFKVGSQYIDEEGNQLSVVSESEEGERVTGRYVQDGASVTITGLPETPDFLLKLAGNALIVEVPGPEEGVSMSWTLHRD